MSIPQGTQGSFDSAEASRFAQRLCSAQDDKQLAFLPNSFRVQRLQRLHLHFAALESGDAVGGGSSC